MIQQATISEIESRTECNVYDGNGFLPLITAPMFSVVDESNYQIFLDNKIQVCLPRKCNIQEYEDRAYLDCFNSYSLEDFISRFCNKNYVKQGTKVLIDVANGNMKKLHDAIRKAKEIHGDRLIIMSGNVSSVEAFVELAKTGVDYIRVGVGGSEVCGTSVNTGVGQDNLEELVKQCYGEVNKAEFYRKYNADFPEDVNIHKVKIVADGITQFQKQLQAKTPPECMDNGYAAINRLLYAGADLVMVGRIFNKALESSGTKISGYSNLPYSSEVYDENIVREFGEGELFVEYSGMSTHKAQEKYKSENLRPSEGRTKYNKVLWTLNEWLNGAEGERHDKIPGFISMLQSAMSYTNSRNLKEFKQ